MSMEYYLFRALVGLQLFARAACSLNLIVQKEALLACLVL